jgi:hypothetical protein
MGPAVRGRALALGLLAAACSSPSTPTPTPSPTPRPKAALAVTVEAQPLVPSGDPSRPTLASWTVVIQETNGVGASVNFVHSNMRDARSGATARPTGSIALAAPEIAALIGTTRLEARGTLRVPESLAYGLVSGGRAVRLTVAVQARDDSQNTVTGTAEAVFQ